MREVNKKNPVLFVSACPSGSTDLYLVRLQLPGWPVILIANINAAENRAGKTELRLVLPQAAAGRQFYFVSTS